MIELNKGLLVGMGSRRDVYLDPRENGKREKCIKITTLEKKLKAKAENKHWYKKFRSLNYFDENTIEIRAYRHIKNEEIYENVPRFYGTVETNLGKAIVVDYIDGAISVRNFIKKYGIKEDFKTALKEMFRIFVKNNLTIRDCSPENYVVKIIGDKLKIYLVDGLGSANLIPLNRWIPYFGRKQTIRRIRRMIDRFKNTFPEYETEFEVLKKEFNEMLPNI